MEIKDEKKRQNDVLKVCNDLVKTVKLFVCLNFRIQTSTRTRICPQDHKRDLAIVDNILEEANRIRDSAKQAQDTLGKLEEKRKQLHDKCRLKHEEFSKIRAELQDLDRLLKEQKTVYIILVIGTKNIAIDLLNFVAVF